MLVATVIFPGRPACAGPIQLPALSWRAFNTVCCTPDRSAIDLSASPEASTERVPPIPPPFSSDFSGAIGYTCASAPRASGKDTVRQSEFRSEGLWVGMRVTVRSYNFLSSGPHFFRRSRHADPAINSAQRSADR